MAKKNNIYMGFNSVAGIYSKGKVDTDWEILLQLYAEAYDATNDILLTNVQGKFTKTDINEVKSRFRILNDIAKKYRPSLLPTLKKIEAATIDNLKGKISDKRLLSILRKVLLQHGVPDSLIVEAEQKINFAESLNSMANIIPNISVPKKDKKIKKPNFKIQVPEIKMPNFNFFGSSNSNKRKNKNNNKSLFDVSSLPFLNGFNFDFNFFGKNNSNKKIRGKKK